MPKRALGVRHVALTAIAAAALSLLVLPAAQAGQPNETTQETTQETTIAAKAHHARSHVARSHGHRHVARKDVAPTSVYNSDTACSSHEQMQPPCMSTFPAGSPNYHGPVPGPN
jgi:hypothetical protein